MKKAWTLAAVVIVHALIAAPAAAQSAEQAVQVVSRVANVRDSDSLKGEVIFQVYRGDVLRLHARSGDWYFVEDRSGRRGYISRTLVETVQLQPARPAIAPPAPTVTQKVEQPQPAAPVRTEPAQAPMRLAAQQAPAASKPGFAEWNNRLELAKAKRGKGIKFILIGLGTTVGGSAVLSRSSSPGLIQVVAMSGMGVAGYGGWTLYKAKQEIEDLDREGRMNGYLTLAPIPGGAQMSARLTF